MNTSTFKTIAHQFSLAAKVDIIAKGEDEIIAIWANIEKDSAEWNRLVGVVRFQNEVEYAEEETDNGYGEMVTISYATGSDTAVMDKMKAAFVAAGLEVKVEDDEEMSNETHKVQYLVVGL